MKYIPYQCLKANIHTFSEPRALVLTVSPVYSGIQGAERRTHLGYWWEGSRDPQACEFRYTVGSPERTAEVAATMFVLGFAALFEFRGWLA